MLDIGILRDIERALADLPNRRLHRGVFAAHRDKHAAAGNHRGAALWQALAVAIAEIDDSERLTLRYLDSERHGLSAQIVDDDGENSG